MSKTSKRLTMKSGNNSTYPLFRLYTGKPVIELWNEDRLLNNFLVEASNAPFCSGIVTVRFALADLAMI